MTTSRSRGWAAARTTTTTTRSKKYRHALQAEDLPKSPSRVHFLLPAPLPGEQQERTVRRPNSKQRSRLQTAGDVAYTRTQPDCTRMQEEAKEGASNANTICRRFPNLCSLCQFKLNWENAEIRKRNKSYKMLWCRRRQGGAGAFFGSTFLLTCIGGAPYQVKLGEEDIEPSLVFPLPPSTANSPFDQ